MATNFTLIYSLFIKILFITKARNSFQLKQRRWNINQTQSGPMKEKYLYVRLLPECKYIDKKDFV
jgi:hypothetical protein